MLGKCPKCEKTVSRATIGEIEASVGIGHRRWRAVSFNCPSCSTVLGVQIDPIAIKADIIAELKRTRE